MKKLFAISLCGIVLFAGHSLFAQSVGQCQANYTPIQCGYYQEAYQDGVADAQNNRSNDYKRYRSKLDGSKYENYFKQGYDAGYSAVKPYQRWDKDQKSVYDAGFQKGDSDKRRNISRLPERYDGQYNRTYEAFFKQGYYDGFDGRSKQYDVPVGNVPPVNPNNPTFPATNPTFPTTNPTFPTNPVKIGTATGNISWNGRVDDRTNIVIQGDQVTEQVIAGGGGFVRRAGGRCRGRVPRRSTEAKGGQMNLDFRSDNVMGVSPAIMAAIGRANTGSDASYGGDAISARLKTRLRELFETDCEVVPVATGTAANALALALGQVAAFGSDGGVVALGEAKD